MKVSYHSNPNKELATYAVLDDQSTDVFISDTLLDRLEVDAPDVDLQVNTIRTKKVAGSFIQDMGNEYTPIEIPFAYSREYIPASHEDIATPCVASQWTHLSHIADKIQHRSDVDIGLLIGRNVPAAFQPMNVISGQEDEPWAEQYKFGWTIIGRVCKNQPSQPTPASVNRVIVERETLLDRAIETPGTHPFISPTLSSKEMTSPKQVRKMMKLDYSEIHHSR